MFSGTKLRRPKQLAAAVLLLVTLIPHHSPGEAGPSGKPFSFRDLHYTLWKCDLAPALTQEQRFDFLIRSVTETIDVEHWRAQGGTEGTLTGLEGTIHCYLIETDRCRLADDL